MGQQDACFKQQSPFISLTTTTSTSTTVEPDFFLLPTSGKPCPHGFLKTIGQNTLLEPPLQNETLTFVCDNDANYPNPCVRTVPKYIKVADIVLEPFDCPRYKLMLDGADQSSFIINNLDLYIDGDVLNFNRPTKSYNISIDVLDPASFELSSSVNYSIAVSSCPCDYTTTTTTTTSSTSTSTTSTTTTLAPVASSECAEILAFTLAQQGAFDIVINNNVVTASIQTVSESWMELQNSTNIRIWGNPSAGFRIDSYWPYAVVHSCIASPSSVTRLKFITRITQSTVNGAGPGCPYPNISSKPIVETGVCVAVPTYPWIEIL